MNNDKRLRIIQAELQKRHLDAMALVPGPNLLYVSGIHAHLSERPLVFLIPVVGEPAVIIPRLEASKAAAAGVIPARVFAWGDGEGYMGAFQQACRALGMAGKTLAVEKLYMRVFEWDLIEEFAAGIQREYADPILNGMRLCKDEEELARMARAVAVAEAAMKAVLPRIESGLTEKQVAAMLNLALLDAGADKPAFDPIVASGPNGASPHAVPTDRPLADGELLTIDWGAIVDDYPSDLTRTFAVGEVSDELKNLYDVVRAANEAGVAAVRPGNTCSQVDEAARGVIEAAGYGEYFIHRTGHGLGLEVHEAPSMMTGVADPLVPGMTFTVEPGVYVPDLGGARIEDNIVVTPRGHRLLTSFPRELIQVG